MSRENQERTDREQLYVVIFILLWSVVLLGFFVANG